jgi:hypothetical protein
MCGRFLTQRRQGTKKQQHRVHFDTVLSGSGRAATFAIVKKRWIFKGFQRSEGRVSVVLPVW